MSTTQVFDVTFRVVKLSAGGAGSAYQYVKPERRANVAAASIHPKDLLATLNNDIPVNAGETLEILHARPFAISGTERSSVLS